MIFYLTLLLKNFCNQRWKNKNYKTIKIFVCQSWLRERTNFIKAKGMMELQINFVFDLFIGEFYLCFV